MVIADLHAHPVATAAAAHAMRNATRLANRKTTPEPPTDGAPARVTPDTPPALPAQEARAHAG